MNKVRFFAIILCLIFIVFISTNSFARIFTAVLEFRRIRLPEPPPNPGEYCARLEIIGLSATNFRRGFLKTPVKVFGLDKFPNEENIYEFFFTSYEELIDIFPQGDYLLSLSGRQSKVKLPFSINKPQFPDYPEVLSPKDFNENVELTPTISWLYVGGDYLITISKESTNEIVFCHLTWPKNVTSITVPEHMLEINTWYILNVSVANVPGFDGISDYRVYFKTAAE